MTDPNRYLAKRGITEVQMADARRRTQNYIDADALRAARAERGMTQVQLAEVMDVSQNCVSRMESGDMAAMSLDAIRCYIGALGGKISLVAELPSGRITLL